VTIQSSFVSTLCCTLIEVSVSLTPKREERQRRELTKRRKGIRKGKRPKKESRKKKERKKKKEEPTVTDKLIKQR